MNKVINVVDDFNRRPSGRYPKDGLANGQDFRNIFLIPALNEHKFVTVNLTGYNRYGPSFLDEAFGGLVRDGGFSFEELNKRLIITHEHLRTAVNLAWNRIKDASAE